MPRSIVKAVQTIILFLLILIAVGFWTWEKEFQGFSLAGLWMQTDRALFFISIVLISFALPCVSLRWRALFPPAAKRESSVFMLTSILCSAFVFNLALPGPVGEGLSGWIASRKYPLSFSEALASLGISRVIGLGSACLVAGGVYWIAPFDIPEEWSLILRSSAIVLLIGAAGLSSLIIFPRQALRLLQKIRTIKLFSLSFIQKIFSMAEQFLTALIETAGRGVKPYLECLSWALFGHVMVGLGIALAVKSMGMTAPWSAVLFTYSASIAGSVAMFLLPGSQFGWDALFASTLSVTAQLPLPVAISVTVVIRIQQTLVALWGIAVIWLYASDIVAEFSKRKKEDLAQAEDST